MAVQKRKDLSVGQWAEKKKKKQEKKRRKEISSVVLIGHTVVLIMLDCWAGSGTRQTEIPEQGGSPDLGLSLSLDS